MEIECEFSYIRNKYSCTVKQAFITRSESTIKAFIGNHLPGKSNHDVKVLVFDKGNCIYYFPHRLNKFFPRLTSLYIGHCELKAISREDLSGMENLKEMRIVFNQLRSLPSNLLTGMRKLKRISFSNNKLEFISSDLLRPLLDNQIEMFSLSNNSSINEFYDASHGSLNQLMNIIDEKCKKPKDEDDYGLIAKKQGFKELLTTGKYSDFAITAGKNGNVRRFKVHKNILGPQSDVFAAIIDTKMEEKKGGEMRITDFSSEVVGELLRFIYTGEMPETENAMDLFALAAKYEVNLLKIRCEEMILRNINEENALDVLNLGYLYIADDMKEAAFKEIKKNFPDAELDESLKDNPNLLKKLIDARSAMKRKFEQATNEYEKVLKMFKKK